MVETQIPHGGNLEEARRLFPDAPEPWVDLSTGINPIAYPMPALPASSFERLPTPDAHADLEAAAAESYEATDAAGVVAAPGTQILISLLPHLRPRSKVSVLGPTYAEHAHAWRRAGHEVVDIVSPDDDHETDVLVIVNPNNPDGRVLQRRMLIDLASRLHRRGGWLVVDEAFADFDSGETMVSSLPNGTIVLRSFGKTYGLAGIRLGFAVAQPDIAGLVRAALGPWAVAGPAIEVGRKALRDRQWRVAAAEARANDAAHLDRLLQQAIGTTSMGTTLYRLIENPAAANLFTHLGRRGIWTRPFKDNPNRLRFGLPGSDEAWARLETALAEFASKVERAATSQREEGIA
ncbi:threonine-phosphate decarboxylase [Microvirga sp. KLBC 81]|uniref:threonine-phosphate decarboxylase CobD n=1 Tax=Microvirga sp. KLBC 81 TaxID=1862707 RepID=UPI000D50645E|nr:threonine-phosphate decarboxylase CobD [Microvirga sp. KLBC 81]PVE20332.1 threonine-phosphate decarboxylase [Microvirga sp. KLBC 81]